MAPIRGAGAAVNVTGALRPTALGEGRASPDAILGVELLATGVKCAALNWERALRSPWHCPQPARS